MRLLSLFIVLTFISGCSPAANYSRQQKPEIENASRVEAEIPQNLPENAHHQDWNLILVNPNEALPANFDVVLAEVANEQKVDRRIVDAWESWNNAALEAGHQLFLASAFRTVSRQEKNFNETFQEYLAEGLSEIEAMKKTKEYLTEPGHSEHHTGLALDLVDEEWIIAGKGLEPEYAGEESQKWLVSTMSDYGFILRYPEGKETVTGILYEPWHFRYVGVENAKYIEENSLTLEEYIVLLKRAGK